MVSLEVNELYTIFSCCCLIGFGLFMVGELVATLVHLFKDIVTLSIKD